MYMHLNIIGVLLVTLTLIHVAFPKYFNWTNDLKSLSLMNRQMMQLHTFFIALMLFLMGLLCLTSTNDLIETDFGRKVALGLGTFWTVRLFFQFFVYSSKLWKGKIFETFMHIIFTLLWAYLSGVFLIIACHNI